MRKAALFYNPLSGSRRDRRLDDVESALAVLRDAGVECSAAPTRAESDATGQVHAAILAGCDTVFACGGDGTIHDVAQALVGTDVALGIIPLGTANALAHDLRLPLSVVPAARAALIAQPRRVSVGKVEFLDLEGHPQSRYFVVALGVGVDAFLFYKLDHALKIQWGMAAYYAKALQLWLTHKLERFRVEYTETGTEQMQEAVLTELLAVRIRNFGGLVRELAPGAGLHRDDLRLVLCTGGRASYLMHIIRGLLGARWRVPGIELVHSGKVVCRDSGSNRVFIEADGELLGTLPATIWMVPNALTLLVPEGALRE